MKRVLTALVLIPLVLLAVFKAPNWMFTLLVGLVAMLALKEYLDLVAAYGVKPMRQTAYLVVASMYLLVGSPQFAHAGATIPITLFLALFWPALFLAAGMRDELPKAFPSAAMSGMGVFYIGFALYAVALLQKSWYALIFTFFAVWAGDSVAMYTGNAIGRHKMSPRISPNKTWEGAVGSVAGSVVACWLLTYFAPSIDRWLHRPEPVAVPRLSYMLLAAVLINVAAQLGDLLESLIKRGANVKDSGTLLPGHGGILDRIDALLLAAPVALILFQFSR